MVQDTFRRFAEHEIRPVAEHVHRHNDDIPEDVIAGLAGLGTFGLTVPEQYGGFSAGGEGELLAMVVATEELSRGSLGVGGSLVTRPEILTARSAGRHRGAEARVAAEAGQRRGDARRGGHRARLRLRRGAVTKVRPRVDGDEYVINGVKTWCTFAGRADALVLMARTDPDRSLAHKGLSLFLVPKERAAGHDFRFEQPGGGRMEGGRSTPSATAACTPTR